MANPAKRNGSWGAQITDTRPCVASATFAVALAFATTAGLAAEPGVFQRPSSEGYTLIEEKFLDKDQEADGVNETRLEVYKNSLGQFIGRYTCKGRTWAWGVKRNNDNEDVVNNYTIRDSTGLGQFDERYGGNERTYAPVYCK